MIRFSYRRHGILIEQQWFGEGRVHNPKGKPSVVMAYNVSEKDVHNKKYLSKQQSLLTNLSQDEDVIYQGFRKNTRYEVRRADREGVSYKTYSNSQIDDDRIKQFSDTMVQMFESKQIGG